MHIWFYISRLFRISVPFTNVCSIMKAHISHALQQTIWYESSVDQTKSTASDRIRTGYLDGTTPKSYHIGVLGQQDIVVATTP
jgi:hypothetical protein